MNRPLLIGITGGSGSGKTTFIRELMAGFDTTEVCILSMDEYYKPREKQKIDKQGITNFDLPKSIDKKGFVHDLKCLMGGKPVIKEEYTFNNKSVTPKTLTFQPAKIILVEGLFVFHFKKVKKLLDLKVFLHAKENLKVIRRIKRDQVERNYPLDDVLYRYQYHVLPTFERFIEPYFDEADLVVNNNQHFENGLKVLRGFIKNHLENPENNLEAEG